MSDAIHAPILVAEDEETDVMILRVAAQKAGLPNPLVFTRDGAETIDYLKKEAPEPGHTPRLIIVDLKMPGLTGFDVLEWLCTRPDLRQIPAVVLTSSSHEDDIAKAHRLGAREYHVKPHSLPELTTLLEGLAERWLTASAPQT
jgi:CheY-like chemotaxis protein